jgi:peptidoglycan LD-endopeptidase LytH
MILEKSLSDKNLVWLDFTASNKELAKVDLKDTKTFSKYVFAKLSDGKIGIGGWLEDRVIYSRSEHFQDDVEPRSIHLGLDLWVQAGSIIFSPYNAKVFSINDNAGFGDYGPTIILEHEHEKFGHIYTLYGHLSRKSIADKKTGQVFRKGDLIAEVGNFPENGDWPPHLHFQVMRSMEGNTVDYPGVCSKKMLPHYSQNCIDPINFLGIKKGE